MCGSRAATLLKPLVGRRSGKDGGFMGSLAVSEVCWLDGSVALVVRGVVDDATVEHFERRLDSAIGTSRRLVVDLTGCQLASAGLAALVRLERRLRGRPAAPSLVATGVDLLRMLQIVGLTPRFRIYATLDAALHSCRSAAPPLAEFNGAAAARPPRQTGPRGGVEVRHRTRIEGFGPARFSRPVERGGRTVGRRSRAATGAGNE
jgi:anti-anti-sigma factor